MIDDNDIQKLGTVFATKNQIQEMLDKNNKRIVDSLAEVFVTKTDLEIFKEEYKQEFSKVLNPIDKNIGREVDEAQEQTMLKNKVDRHDKWINKIAEKVDLKLES